MKLTLEWQPALNLTDGSDCGLIYQVNPVRVPEDPGIYVFARKYGTGIEALYVGKANNLRSRIKTQLKNLPLMVHILNSLNGSRILLCGKFKPKPGQTRDTCLPILERALIRHFLSEGHDLVNKHGTLLKQHEIKSNGTKHIPSEMFAEK